jgi:ferrochelatase
VLTFHGLPERYVTSGDPYREHCDRTVAALTRVMGWDPGDYTVAFQSRFGPEKWIGPSTAEVLEGLHARNIHRPLVVAPGFTTDCLETLDELGNEGRHEFVKGGGARSDYALCPCLNDHETWIQTMVELVKSASPTKP